MEEQNGANLRKEHERKRMAAQKKRRQQVKIRRILLAAAVLIVGLSVAGVYGVRHMAQNSEKKSESKKSVQEGLEEQKKEEEQTQSEDQTNETSEEERAKEIEQVREQAKASGCPDEILSLLDRNEETLDFVRSYAEKKDIPPAENLGIQVNIGEVPLLLQWDDRWGYQPYGSSTIAVSGSAPSCMAMVIVSLTNDGSVTPYLMAQKSMESGWVDAENHTSWEFMKQAASGYHIACVQLPAREEQISRELEAGHPLICSVGPGVFADREHFIVLSGYEDGMLTIRDPFSMANSGHTWKFSDLEGQMNALWSYSVYYDV